MKYPDFTNALCKEIGIEFFFPEKGHEQDAQVAKSICIKCPVIKECLEWGLHHESHGIWGGTNERQRRGLRKKRKIKVHQLLSQLYY
jgi:WhiB family redox-sensing transcriptional regulator